MAEETGAASPACDEADEYIFLFNPFFKVVHLARSCEADDPLCQCVPITGATWSTVVCTGWVRQRSVSAEGAGAGLAALAPTPRLQALIVVAWLAGFGPAPRHPGSECRSPHMLVAGSYGNLSRRVRQDYASIFDVRSALV